MPKSILFAEDDRRVRKAARKVLVDAGYHVLAVADGQAALDTLEDRAAIDLVVLDIRMPKVSGIEVYEWLVEEAPHIPVLFATGYASELEAGLPEIDTPILEKPYAPRALLEEVESLIGAATLTRTDSD